MSNPTTRWFVLFVSLGALAACGGTTTFGEPEDGGTSSNGGMTSGSTTGDTTPDVGDPEVNPNLGFSCETGAAEPFPGYPFDVTVYNSTVQPIFDNLGCAASGCHAPASAAGGLALHPEPEFRSEEFFQNLCSVKTKVNWEDVASSLILTEPLPVEAGGTAHSPIKWEQTTDPNYQAVLGFLTQAKQFLDASQGQNSPTPDPANGNERPLPPVSTSPFDFNVFQTTIQPLFDDPQFACSNATSCHGVRTNVKLVLTPNPAANSEAMKRNFYAVTDPRFYDFGSIDQSLLLSKPSGVNHTGGMQFSEGDATWTALRDWIVAARASLPADQRNEGQDDPRIYELQRFEDEIMPLLNAGTQYNCASSVCHGNLEGGQPTGAGRLFLWDAPADGSEQMLENYASVAAFINLDNPTQSTLLTRGRGIDHPGGIQFDDERDLAYLTILDWILEARGYTHLDPVYFSLRVQEIFSNPEALGEANDLITTCASLSCHGNTNTGLPPGNGSDFSLLAFPNEPAHYAYNFNSASNFVNRADPLQSALLLYPLSTEFGGVPHPGGNNLSPEGPGAIYYEALTRWLEGLRPNDGFLREWVVLGPIEAAPGNNDLPYLPDEANLVLNYGQTADPNYPAAEAILSDGDRIRLAGYFGGDTANKVAYAMTYVWVNGDVTLDLGIGSDDSVKVWVGNMDGPMELVHTYAGERAAEPDTDVVPIQLRGGLNRIMFKVLNLDGSWAFFARLIQGGVGYEAATIKLTPEGGAGLVGGGQEPPQYDYEVLFNDTFRNVVVPGLEQTGCGNAANGACHQTGAGGFTFLPGQRDEAGLRQNFESIARNPRVRLGLDNYEDSRILMAPLNNNHADRGGIYRQGANDPVYTQIKDWIYQGALAQ